MSKIVAFPLPTSPVAPPVASSARATVGRAADLPPRAHAVQFYQSDDALFDTVATFLEAGLDNGDRLLVIGTAEHFDAFVARLGVARVAAASQRGELLFLDAHETLARIMLGDLPDPEAFRNVLEDALRRLRERGRGVRVRAFGEMVDVLWRDGNTRAAIRLEQLWAEAGEAHDFCLLCAYAMGNFYRSDDSQRFVEICAAHTHVIPTDVASHVEDLSGRAREIARLEQRASVLEAEIEHRRRLEHALRDALRECGRIEEQLRAAMVSERDARARAEASESFKEMFLAMLGHDLRNPLSTILVTAQIMEARDALSPQGATRVERILASARRMEKLIDQIFDVTRARHTGLSIERGPEQDLVELVARIVEEMRVAYPERVIEMRGERPFEASVDAGRIEQVVSNLLGNALAHGDSSRPIRVTVDGSDVTVRVTVHNHGTPIDPEFMPLLFDPFRRAQSHGRNTGLGLGLYIAEKIVSGHGGRIEVESGVEVGTRFTVVLPRRAGGCAAE